MNENIIDKLCDGLNDYIDGVLNDWKKDKDNEVEKVLTRIENFNCRNFMTFWH